MPVNGKAGAATADADRHLAGFWLIASTSERRYPNGPARPRVTTISPTSASSIPASADAARRVVRVRE
jgi:hypothetical protein